MARARTQTSLAGRRCRRNLATGCVVLLAGMWISPLVAGAASEENEFRLKAGFLCNLSRFVEWPAGAFSAPRSPLVIGILGADPFGAALEDAMRGQTANERRLRLERYGRVDQIHYCHILFVSGSEAARSAEIAAALTGRPILTVCDWEGFMHHDGMIWFATVNGRIRLRINREALRGAGLVASSKLLRCAQPVTNNQEP